MSYILYVIPGDTVARVAVSRETPAVHTADHRIVAAGDGSFTSAQLASLHEAVEQNIRSKGKK